MNPCPCGFLGSPHRPCRCSGLQVEQYQNKISGPLLDRIDIHLQVPAMKPLELWNTNSGERSFTIKKRTVAARTMQLERFKNTPLNSNAQMSHVQVQEYCKLDEAGRDILLQAMDKLKLSARAHDKIIKVARTIADLEGVPRITKTHIAEAIGYRTLDRELI
jgi:magnesium chelatase family protein